MNKFEKTDQKSSKIITLRSAWVITFACTLLLIGITSVLSSSHKSTLSTPITGWSVGDSLPVAVAGKNAVAHDADGDGQDDYVFLAGGRVSGIQPTDQVTDQIYVGTVEETGNISGWAPLSTALPERRFLHSLNATDTHMFLIGGWNGSATQKTVHSAPIEADGTLGDWTSQEEHPAKISQHGSVIAGNYIYVLGGYDGSSPQTSVRVANIGSNGSVTGWRSAQALPQKMRRVAAVTVGNRIYVTGGVSDNEAPLDSVYYATILNDGLLSTWLPATNLPKNMFYHQAVVHDGKIVVLGGKSIKDGTDILDVYSASILNNGSLSAWGTEPSMPVGLFRFAAVTLKRYGSEYIAVIGGGKGQNLDPELQNGVYYSDVPPTPTPTFTPTPVFTPTPPVVMDASLDNSPASWVAPGESITYTITYENQGPGNASNTEIRSKIPANTEFVSADPSTGVLNTSQSGDEVSWDIGFLPDNGSRTVAYTVRRAIPTPSQEGAVGIKLSGPTSGTAQEPLTYTLEIKSAVDLTVGSVRETTVAIKLPPGVEYEGSSPTATLVGDTILWGTPNAVQGEVWQLFFTVKSASSFVFHDYNVRAILEPTGDLACCGVGADVHVTTIDGQPVIGPGDGITIVNDDVSISWDYNGQPGTFRATRVANPKIPEDFVFLPYVTR